MIALSTYSTTLTMSQVKLLQTTLVMEASGEPGIDKAMFVPHVVYEIKGDTSSSTIYPNYIAFQRWIGEMCPSQSGRLAINIMRLMHYEVK